MKSNPFTIHILRFEGGINYEETYELDYTQLKNYCTPDNFRFQTTAELEPLEGIIGQERAVKAFDFGLAVKMKGYNIYMSVPSDTGKTTYARRSTEKLAATEPVPTDWRYVHNFQNPQKPIALYFEAGVGKHFKEDMVKLAALFKKSCQRKSKINSITVVKHSEVLHQLSAT